MIKKSSKKATIIAIIFVFILSALLITVYVINNNYVVKVGGHRITEADITDTYNQLSHFYEQSDQIIDQDLIRSEATNRAIDRYIVSNFAQENKIIVSDEQINNYFQQRVAAADSEEALLEQVYDLYGINKDQYLDVLTFDLLRDSLSEIIQQPYTDWLETQRQILGVEYK